MSSYAFNPFTSNLDIVGSGASYIDGVVATPASLPITLNTPALDSVYLAKAGSGVWLISRRPAGLYCRTANNGVAADWTHLGAFPEVNADGNWELYNTADPTKELKFDLSGISTGTTRTLIVPNNSGTIALLANIPAAFDAANPGTIGGTTPGAATFTNLTANTRVNLPNTNGTTAGDIYRNANTLRYRDSSNTERLLLNASDNLANLASASAARINLGVGSSDAVTFGSIQNTPIGSTTAAAITGTTGTFTTLSAAPTSGSALTLTGGTVTASAPLIDATQTWNNAAVTFTGFRLNATNTASASGSLLADFQVGGISQFSVRRDGRITLPLSGGGLLIGTGSALIDAVGGSTIGIRACQLGWDSNPIGIANQTFIFGDASNVISQRNGTSAQEYRLHGTFTSSTNYQRMTVKSVRQTLSALSGASATTTGPFIPDGAVVVGVTTRVATALTGAAGYTIGDGADADRWGDITGTAIGTTSDNRDWTAGTVECFTTGGNITLTAKTSNFTAGAVEICVFYLAGEAD